MRIIFVTSKINFIDAGGSVTDLDLKAEDLLKLGHDVSVVTVYSHKNKIDKDLAYKVIKEQFPSFHQLSVQYRIFKLLRKYQNQADIFHVEGQYMYGVGLYRLLKGKVPIITFYNREFISWPTEDGRKEKAMNFLQRLKAMCRYFIEKNLAGFLARQQDHYIITTPFLRDRYYKFGLSRKVPIDIMPDFVDDQRILRSAGMSIEQVTTNRAKPKKVLQIYCTGRMVAGKGFDLVVKAFAELDTKQDYRLIIGGDGYERKNLEQMAQQLGVHQYIEFPGWVTYDQMVNYLVTSDIFILPRWHKELTSVVLFEAMAVGLPAIVPSGGGLQWLVDNPELTFEIGDYRSLAQRISQLGKADQDQRAAYGMHCLKQVTEVFDHRKFAKRIDQIAQQLYSTNR